MEWAGTSWGTGTTPSWHQEPPSCPVGPAFPFPSDTTSMETLQSAASLKPSYSCSRETGQFVRNRMAAVLPWNKPDHFQNGIKALQKCFSTLEPCFSIKHYGFLSAQIHGDVLIPSRWFQSLQIPDGTTVSEPDLQELLSKYQPSEWPRGATCSDPYTRRVPDIGILHRSRKCHLSGSCQAKPASCSSQCAYLQQ